jgi:TetR/AcrR family transcriptional regulator, transcriptional repressor for nem operon
MRYEKGRKENTRKHIIEVAAQRFRKDGASASGLAGIMAAAGLTNGAFYPHFESKEALLREALVNALTEQHARLEQDCPAGCDIEVVIRRHLNRDELACSENGCPSAALLPEISRQPERTRKAYEDALLPYISALATHLPDSGSSNSRAMAIFSLMVGTLQISRAVADTSLAHDLLEDGVKAALILAGKS